MKHIKSESVIRTIILIALCFSYVTSRAQKSISKNELFTILITGAPTRKSQIASQLAPKFGFQYKYISYRYEGNMVIPPDIDSMHSENEKVYNLISKKNGPDWEKKFKEEVERTYINWCQIREFLKSDTIFDSICNKLKLENYGDFEIIKEIEKNKEFIIEYTFFDSEKHITLDIKKFRVNLPERKMKMVAK